MALISIKAVHSLVPELSGVDNQCISYMVQKDSSHSILSKCLTEPNLYGQISDIESVDKG